MPVDPVPNFANNEPHFEPNQATDDPIVDRENPQVSAARQQFAAVNQQLRTRNIEIPAIDGDIGTLLNAVNVAVLMVDPNLRLRSFNPAAENMLDLAALGTAMAGDSIKVPELRELVKEALQSPGEIERTFQDQQGHWYSAVARTYKSDSQIAGAVITIGNIKAPAMKTQPQKDIESYADVIEIIREPLVVLDSELRVLRATSGFSEAFLVTPKEIQGQFLYELGNGQWNDPELRKVLIAALVGNEPFRDYKLVQDFPHKGRRTMCLNGRRISETGSKSPALLLAIEDITDRPEVAEVWFRRIFETAKDGIMVVDAETETIADINPSLLSMTGLGRDAIVGCKFTEAEPFRNLRQTAHLMAAVRAAETVRFDDLPLRKADGGTMSTELVANLYELGTRSVVQFNFRDITARKEEQEILRRSLEEKALLVREIHHRVKNNLQVIVSLLSLQAGYTTDETSIAAFEEMERRVRAIARIHETLYASPDLAQIEFATYLTRLTQELMSFHRGGSDAIELRLSAEEMVLQMEQAIPLGLIANELILNSLKHGLAGGRGKLAVTLQYRREPGENVHAQNLDEGWARLEVFDDGPGLPPNIDLPRARSMGLRLLHLLVTQLRGEVTFLPGPGANIRVDFPLSYAVA